MAHVPLLVVRGTHYEVGYKLGSSFKQLAQDYYTNHEFLPRFQDYYYTEKGKEFCEDLWGVGRERFPHYMEEVNGIADGSELDLTKVLLMLIERELEVKLGLLEEMFNPEGIPPKGCTDVLVNTGDQLLIGHNEDWASSMAGRDCLLMADISPYTADDGRVFPAEKFVVHTWPGLLMGLASGFNCHGLAYSIDHLYPKCTSSKGKTADILLSRHLLSATSLPSAVDILTDEGYGVAVGFCANIGMMGGEVLLNIEIACKEGLDRSDISVVEVSPTSPAYAHYNNFERLEPEAYILDHCKGRRQRMDQLPNPTDLSSMLRILGDYGADDAVNNIYQDPGAGFPWATLATVVFDLKTKGVMIFYRGPAHKESPILSLPFSLIM